jgi:hemoglobin
MVYMNEDIQDRDDVSALVSAFYAKVRANKEIGHFFNETIRNWPEHLEKLTDFWETNLFMVSKFHGNPIRAHKQVDEAFKQSIEQRHFGEWLNMWFATVDEMFTGEMANIAKNRARNMAHNLFMNMYMGREAAKK